MADTRKSGKRFGRQPWGSTSDGEKMYVAVSDVGIGAKPDVAVP